MKRLMRRGAVLAVPVLCVAAVLVPATAQAATADLAITKTDSPDPVKEGAVLTYTIGVSNLGPDSATGVTVTDQLDSHLDFVSATSSQGTCKRKGKKVTCDVGTVVGSPYAEYTNSVTITIKVRPNKTGQLTNTATVAVGNADTDPNGANNSATQTTTVVAAGGGGRNPMCAGRAATIVGTGGSDTLRGTPRRDVIKARGGNDVIRGLQSSDIVCAGAGNDTARGGPGNDLLKGGSGRDFLKGGGGNDDLLGGPGRDRCRGGAGRDTKRSC